MKIPNNKIYKVSKIKVKDYEKSRQVDEGFVIEGYVLRTEPNMYIAGQRGFDVVETSPVENITDLGDGNFLVNTRNSVYTVVEVK